MLADNSGRVRGGGYQGETPLIPDLQEAIPGPGCYGEAVVGHSETGDTVVMSGQHADPLSLESIPDIAVKVVVAGEEETAALGESYRCDSTHYHVMGVHHQFLMGEGGGGGEGREVQ